MRRGTMAKTERVQVTFDTAVTADDPGMTEEDWANLGRFVADVADEKRARGYGPGHVFRGPDPKPGQKPKK
jgi:hypothetical protein